MTKKAKLYASDALAQWRADAKAGGARTRMNTRTKTYNRYIALLDGVIVGWFVSYAGKQTHSMPSGGRLHLAYADEYKRAIERQAAAIRFEMEARKVVAILDVQWGSATADRWFRINPYNHSGRRLIRLIGHENFLVTNACPQAVANADGRGKPDRDWLASNLAQLRPSVVLVCGNVAQATFERGMVAKGAKVLKLPHPAARTWTKAGIAAWSKRIQNAVKGV